MIGNYWKSKYRNNENCFYSPIKNDLFKIRYSEVFALLNCLSGYQNSDLMEISQDEQEISRIVEHIGFINDWAKGLIEDTEIQSSDSELFYENLIKKNAHWLVEELKIAYYSKIGMAENKIYTLKRIDENELNRIKSKIKKRLGLRRNESLSYYLACFN